MQADVMPYWEDVVLLELPTCSDMCCPISLDVLELPYITPCGHTFSLVSIVGYIMSKNDGDIFRGSCPCPLCAAPIVARGLRPVQIRHLKYCDMKEGDIISLRLVRRNRNSTIVSASQDEYPSEDCLGDYPVSMDVFSRVSIIKNPKFLWSFIIKKLVDAREIVRVEGGEEAGILIPAYLAAIQLILEQSKIFVSKRRQQELEIASQGVLDDITANKKIEDIYSDLATLADELEEKCKLAEEQEKIRRNLDSEFPSLGGAKETETLPLNHKHEKKTIIMAKSLDDDGHDEGDPFKIYQAADGGWVFLSMFNMSILGTWKKNHVDIPEILEAPIVALETVFQTEAMRKRYKVLSHIPLTAPFKFCEVDLDKIVPRDVLSLFQDEIKQRRVKRINAAKQKAKKLIKEAEAQKSDQHKAPTLEELLAMPRLREDDDDQISTMPVSSSPMERGGVSFARIAKLGFAATGPALGKEDMTVLPQASRPAAYGDREQATSHPTPWGGVSSTSQSSKKKGTKVLFSTSMRQY